MILETLNPHNFWIRKPSRFVHYFLEQYRFLLSKFWFLFSERECKLIKSWFLINKNQNVQANQIISHKGDADVGI